MGSSSRNRHPLTRPHPAFTHDQKENSLSQENLSGGCGSQQQGLATPDDSKWRKNGVETHPKAHYTIITMKIDTSTCGENGHHKLRGTKAMTLPEGPSLNKGASQPESGVRIWHPEAWRNPSLTLDTHKTPRTNWFANSVSR